LISLRYFFVSLQFQRVCVRDTLARRTPLAFRSCRVRGMLSVTATPDLHFWISISFWKIAERTNPRPFQFVLASPWEHPAVPYSARHAVARSSASTRVDNKEASPPGTYLIIFFLFAITRSRVVVAMAPCVFTLRPSRCVRRRSPLLHRFLTAEWKGRWSTGDGPIVQAIACNYSDVAVRLGVKGIHGDSGFRIIKDLYRLSSGDHRRVCMFFYLFVRRNSTYVLRTYICIPYSRRNIIHASYYLSN